MTTRTGRAAPMAPEARRRAIVEAVVPLLLEHGGEVSTRQIAEAAGIAEGTIFRVFPDKGALFLAAAEEVVNPADARARHDASLAGLVDLRDRVRVTVEQMAARSEQVMVVLMALRRLWTSQPADHSAGHRGHRDPKRLFAESYDVQQAMLADVFEPHRDELTVDPETAAILLRTLVLGSRHPGANPAHRLSPQQITDAVLDGILTRSPKEA